MQHFDGMHQLDKDSKWSSKLCVEMDENLWKLNSITDNKRKIQINWMAIC